MNVQPAMTIHPFNFDNPGLMNPFISYETLVTRTKNILPQQVLTPYPLFSDMRPNLYGNFDSNNNPLNTDEVGPYTSKQVTGDRFLDGGYKFRNVFKAIIRKMYTCVREKRMEYVKILQEKGFHLADIENAFVRIANFRSAERRTGRKKMGLKMVKVATQQRSIYSYILRDALESMLFEWSTGRLGRLSQQNLDIYSQVCNTYYYDLWELLGFDSTNLYP